MDLTRRLLRSAKPKQNGVVIVPFAGSGSECVAANELGMSFISFELNQDYIRIAKKRLEKTEFCLI